MIVKGNQGDTRSDHCGVLGFVLHHFNDEWVRLVKECSRFSLDEYHWQAAPDVHSIGWHVRHAIEWRYALVHVLICGSPNDEELTCLGWEKEPIIQAISVNRGWYEPRVSVEEDIEYLQRVRAVTNRDLETLPASRFWEEIRLPWRTNCILHEAFQDIRHSSLHRGHMREIKRAFDRVHGVTEVMSGTAARKGDSTAA
jgi:hypothetical protein